MLLDSRFSFGRGGFLRFMTLTEAQQLLHSLLEFNTDYPSEGDEDWEVRTQLFNSAIRTWENLEGVQWRELFADLSDASDGDTETEANEATYDAPSDFRAPAGFLTLGTGDSAVYYQQLPEYKKALDWSASDKFYYLTGNQATGFKVHLHPTPTTVATINYPYYKQAASLSDTTDAFEMADPEFAVYWALAKLQEEEGGGDIALQIAQQKLNAMKTANLMMGWYQNGQMNGFDVGGGFGR